MKVKFDVKNIGEISVVEPPQDVMKAYRQAIYEQRETLESNMVYRLEKELFDCVRSGNTDTLNHILRNIAINDHYVGYLSKDPLRQVQYIFVSGIALATRSAIEGGMPEIEAYNLSDVYIQKMDICKSTDEVNQLFVVAIFDFTKRVRKNRKQRAYSYPVTQSIAYILDHLHYQITLTGLAKHCGLTPQYLSSLFHKETGRTITDYIMNERLEAAKQMLLFSEAGLQEISSNLAFSSHSNFTMHFKKSYGMTPREYRQGRGSRQGASSKE